MSKETRKPPFVVIVQPGIEEGTYPDYEAALAFALDWSKTHPGKFVEIQDANEVTLYEIFPPMLPEHEAKVRECLAILQDAQNLVETAAQALCSVPGFSREWSALSKPHEVVKEHWYIVASRLDAMRPKGVNHAD